MTTIDCNTKEIPLGRGLQTTIVDADMHDFLTQKKWHLRNGYPSRAVRQAALFIDRIIEAKYPPIYQCVMTPLACHQAIDTL